MSAAGRRRDALWLAVLLGAGVGLPYVASLVTGAIDIPRNDDWTYRRFAIELATTGSFALDGTARTMIIGQLITADPLLWISGTAPWAFAVDGIAFALLAIVGAYALARRFLPPGMAFLPVALLILFPGYLAYATSFMSDAPGLAVQIGCLALGAVALSGPGVAPRWLIAAAIAGCYAFSIREFSAAAPVAVLVAAIVREPRSRTTWLITGVVVAWCVGLIAWRAGLPGQLGDIALRRDAAIRLLRATATLALVLLPAATVVLARRPMAWSRRGAVVGGAVGIALLGGLILAWSVGSGVTAVLLENLLSPYGVPGAAYMVGGRPLVLPDPVWLTLNAIAAAALPLVALTIGGLSGDVIVQEGGSVRRLLARLGTPAGSLVLFVCFVAAGLVVFGVQWWIYDRYLWPLVPPLAILLLAPVVRAAAAGDPARLGLRRVKHAAAIGAGVTLAAVAMLLMLNSMAFDAARWHAGERLEALGFDPGEIDAGYEWVGAHSTSRSSAAHPVARPIWYRGWWPDFRACAIASSIADPSPGLVAVGTLEWNVLAIAGPTATMHLYRAEDAACID